MKVQEKVRKIRLGVNFPDRVLQRTEAGHRPPQFVSVFSLPQLTFSPPSCTMDSSPLLLSNDSGTSSSDLLTFSSQVSVPQNPEFQPGLSAQLSAQNSSGIYPPSNNSLSFIPPTPAFANPSLVRLLFILAVWFDRRTKNPMSHYPSPFHQTNPYGSGAPQANHNHEESIRTRMECDMWRTMYFELK